MGAGITSDANLLTNELRLIGQRYKYSYGESIPCEQLVSWLCDIKQAYTQSGGKRPFGVSILSWDGTNTSDTSYTSPILLETMEAGKPPVLGTTGMQQFPCLNRNTRRMKPVCKVLWTSVLRC